MAVETSPQSLGCELAWAACVSNPPYSVYIIFEPMSAKWTLATSFNLLDMVLEPYSTFDWYECAAFFISSAPFNASVPVRAMYSMIGALPVAGAYIWAK